MRIPIVVLTLGLLLGCEDSSFLATADPSLPTAPDLSFSVTINAETLSIISQDASTATLEIAYTGSPLVIGARSGAGGSFKPVCPPFHTPANPQPTPATTICQKGATDYQVWAVIEEGGVVRAIGPVTVTAVGGPPPPPPPPPPPLPVGCAAGQTITWDGTQWQCANPSITGWEIVQSSISVTGIVSCPVGKVILGGGSVRVPLNQGTGWIATSGPIQTGPNQWGWQVDYATHQVTGTIYAICADGSP